MPQLTEKSAENFLEKNKFSVAKRAFIKNISQLKKIKISFPWTMKISSKKIMHKTKLGGVILNINSLKKAEESFAKLSKIKFFEEAIVQEMISGKEIAIGIKKTPEFGHALMFGRGGTLVEKNKDVSFRIFPATEKDISEMINETKISKTLTEKEIFQIRVVLKKIQELIKNNQKISELDINPLFVKEINAVVADARIVFG